MVRGMSELTPEDMLRLQVLLAGELHAVRLDEDGPALCALTPRGEARIALHPVGRREAYLTQVRELLGGHALGSPGGYPVHLRRWTRIGQAAPKNLAALLLLGEPEAAMAVAYSPALTDELARRVWWALPVLEVAQVMLHRPAVQQGEMGKVLSAWMLEHLPFQADPIEAMHCVRALLAAGRLDEAQREDLWRKARRRPHYFLGFLEFLPDALPVERPARELPEVLRVEAAAGNLWAATLARLFSARGQSYLLAARLAFDKPPAHEAVYSLFDLIGGHFSALRAASGREAVAACDAGWAEALAALAALSAADAEPILTRTTAVGPQLRRKLEPLLAPILQHLRHLQGEP